MPAVAERDGRGGALPFVIALGGHRDLRPEDVPVLEARVREVLGELGRRLPDAPLLLLSSLAEGADRLGARVAPDMGIDLVAPLPLPPADYHRDFATAPSRQQFPAPPAPARASFAP